MKLRWIAAAITLLVVWLLVPTRDPFTTLLFGVPAALVVYWGCWRFR